MSKYQIKVGDLAVLRDRRVGPDVTDHYKDFNGRLVVVLDNGSTYKCLSVLFINRPLSGFRIYVESFHRDRFVTLKEFSRLQGRWR